MIPEYGRAFPVGMWKAYGYWIMPCAHRQLPQMVQRGRLDVEPGEVVRSTGYVQSAVVLADAIMRSIFA
jgi:hypothetical protein